MNAVSFQSHWRLDGYLSLLWWISLSMRIKPSRNRWVLIHTISCADRWNTEFFRLNYWFPLGAGLTPHVVQISSENKAIFSFVVKRLLIYKREEARKSRKEAAFSHVILLSTGVHDKVMEHALRPIRTWLISRLCLTYSNDKVIHRTLMYFTLQQAPIWQTTWGPGNMRRSAALKLQFSHLKVKSKSYLFYQRTFCTITCQPRISRTLRQREYGQSDSTLSPRLYHRNVTAKTFTTSLPKSEIVLLTLW